MNEVVLSVGVAEILGVEIGDQVEMLDSDMRSLKLTVSGIYDNHVNNYAIVNLDTMASQWGAMPDVQMAFIRLQQEQDAHAVTAEISDLDAVMNVSVSKDLADMVSRMMKALDLVVWVIVVCAGLLAATVLYNLTNININERIREIATIKVLGFNASETGAYVFKENMSLTVAGSIFGLFLGRLLLAFVMSNIKIDFVWFKAIVEAPSYLWALVLTILSAILVDFVFYFKLDKINMAEALKSVE
jgi:putative ABC transport system permease protein